MYPNTFYRASVKALVKNKEGNILVVKENQDAWSLPGGGLNHGEDPQEGILREIKEELGIESVIIKNLVTVKTFYLERKSAWLLWLVYEVELKNNPFNLGEGVTEACYINPESLLESNDVFEKLVYEISKNHNHDSGLVLSSKAKPY